MTFAGILAARMIPELRILARRLSSGGVGRTDWTRTPAAPPRGDIRTRRRVRLRDRAGRLAAPRIAAAAIACLLLSQWGITVGTVVGWQASQSMMGLSTEMFFMMMLKMMWFRDVVGLVVKGLSSAPCRRRSAATRGCGRRARGRARREPASAAPHPATGWRRR